MEFVLALLALILAVVAYFVADHRHKLLIASVVLLSIAVLLGGDLGSLSADRD